MYINIEGLGLKVVVAIEIERGRLLIFGNASFEEVLLLLNVHHFRQPRQRILDIANQRFEADSFESSVRNVVDVLEEIFFAQADGVHGQAIANEIFFQGDRFRHGVAQLLLELLGPDLRILVYEFHEQVAEQLDVVGLVTQRVAEHFAYAPEFVLSIQRKDHAEHSVELGAFHALSEHEKVLGENLLVAWLGEIHVATQSVRRAGNELVLLYDGLDVFEHRLALVRVNAQRADHVEQRVCMDVLFVAVAAENELELGSGHAPRMTCITLSPTMPSAAEK